MKQNTRVQDEWRDLVMEGKTTTAKRRMITLMGMLPSDQRCRLCKMPFTGVSGQLMRALGKSQSNVNPHLCSDCDHFFHMNPGGLEVRLSMLFADIRGSTSLAEQLSPTDFHRMIDRFFATATDVLSKTDALIDKLAGDQVSGYYLPGLAGPKHAGVAIQAAQMLLQATGHADPGGPWIPVGIGIHTGNAFFGSVGTQGSVVDVTALGDAVNVAARLASRAGPGEILVSQEAYAAAGLDPGSRERRELELKGRTRPVTVYVA